jgi:hypothetical protein
MTTPFCRGLEMPDYSIYYKSQLPVEADWAADNRWDLFISAYTHDQRVKRVFDKARAGVKRWIVLPEYQCDITQMSPDEVFVGQPSDEATYIRAFWDSLGPDASSKSLCIDITGFIRSYLLFMVRWLFESGVKRFDAIYSEPVRYVRQEQTQFSATAVEEVRQIAGYEGNHVPDASNDCLIIGAGYEDHLISHVAANKDNAQKVLLYGFPSLRADMYQENVLKAHLAEEAVGARAEDSSRTFFAPANDPFVTANVLHEIVSKANESSPVTNLYLCPLSTKPQALGFALYYLTECLNGPTSMIFPISTSYSPETTSGITRIWKYTVEFPGSL